MAMIKAIHAQERRAEALKKAAFVVERLREMKLKNAAPLVTEGIDDTLSY
jgi:putative transposase